MIIRLKKAMHFFFPADAESKEAFLKLPLDCVVEVDTDGPESPKTAKQRASLHVWCEQMAELLNALGLDQRKVLKPSVEIPWSKDAVKSLIYKPVLDAMTGKKSTEDMNTVEPTQVLEVIARHMAQNHSVTIPDWPSRFSQGLETSAKSQSGYDKAA
jgi:hypothetical protein